MNEKGITLFKTEISVGGRIGISTRDDFYFGEVVSIGEDCLVVSENGLNSYIYYSRVWHYYKD